MKTCSIEGCTSKTFGRGWCVMHYTRWRRNGDPLKKSRLGTSKQGTLRERFEWTIGEQDEGVCWIWPLKLMWHGYGRISTGDGHSINAHRAAFELYVGPIPEGCEVHHTCGNKACVNPAHLETLSVAEHRALGWGRTHCPRGHEYSEVNTYVDRNGVKVCRTCRRTYYKRNR